MTGRVAIIGAGIVGLSTAWALSRRGRRITLFEQGPLPNPWAASNDRHRLIRYAYGASAGYSRMVSEAYGAWNELWETLGRCHYVQTGTLALAHGEGDDDWTQQSRATMQRLGIAHDWWQPADVAARCPHLQADGIAGALFVPQGGVLLADRILRDLAAHLAKIGVELRTHAPVTGVDPANAAVTLEDGHRERFDALVVAAGPWTAQLLPSLASKLTPARQVVSYLEPPAHLAQAWATSPAVVQLGRRADGYAVPPVAGTNLKLGAAAYRRPGDPDKERTTDLEEGGRVLALFDDALADREQYRVIEARVCYYNLSTDDSFILERLGARSWAFCGCSGHGFKFGALLGQALAQAVSGERPADEIRRWAAGAAA